MFERFADKLGLSLLLSAVILVIIGIAVIIGWRIILGFAVLNLAMYVIVDKFDLINK